MSILSLIACALITGGCADPLEQRSTEEVGSQIKRGISGQGQLVPNPIRKFSFSILARSTRR